MKNAGLSSARRPRALARSLLLVVLAGCASTPGGEEGEEEAQERREDACYLVELGMVTIPWRPGLNLSRELRQRGIDRFEDRDAVYSTTVLEDGTLVRRLVGVEGFASRWADPSCRMRRPPLP